MVQAIGILKARFLQERQKMREIPRDALERAEIVVRLIGTIDLTTENWAHAQEHLEQLGVAMQSEDEPRLTDACNGLENLIPSALRGITKVWEQSSREERSSRDRKTPVPDEIHLLVNKVKHSLGNRLDQFDQRAGSGSSNEN